MEGAIVIKLLLAAGGFAVWAYQQMKAKAEQPAPTAMAAPPPIPRRARRPRAVAPKGAAKPAEEPAEGPARPAAAPRPESPGLVVTRAARAPSRPQFRGAAALRQAIVAREVLGPPLCLRPPRF